MSFWLAELAPSPAEPGPYAWLVSQNRGETADTEKIRRAQTAIHSMGPRTVPFLLDRVRRKRALRERAYAAVWHRIPAGIRRRLTAPRQFQAYGNPLSQVVWALQSLDSDAVPALINAVEDSNSDVQITALAALGGFGANADAAMPSLTRLAGHPNGFVRRWAIFTLGRLGPARTNALPILVAALKDDDASPLPGSSARVRETAAEVLGQLGPQARIASPELIKLLSDADTGVRLEAAIALWRIRQYPDVLPIVIAELRKRENLRKLMTLLGEMGSAAKPAVPAIKEALGPSWSQAVRKSRAAASLALANDAGPEATVEEVAGDALRRIDPDLEDELLDTSLLQVSPLSVRAGGSGWVYLGVNQGAWTTLGREAVPGLVKVLDDPDPNSRIGALLTLSRVGWKPDRESVPKLARLVSDQGAFRYRGWEDQDVGREFVCIGDLAAELLGQAGTDARAALASLKGLLADPYWSTRPYAPLAVWRIDQDTNVLRYIVANLQSVRDVRGYRRFLAVAAEMGEAAKPAVPAIVAGMGSFKEDLSAPVREALTKIDRGAAERLEAHLSK